MSNMKKMIAALAASLVAVLMLAMPASATGGGDHPDPHNKKVTFCHATGSESNPFVKIETSVKAFYQAGHINHGDDIWEAFSYTTVGGDVVNVPAQGDTSLLAFDDCEAPPVAEKVAKPAPVFADECGTANDVFSVAPGRGYTVGATQTDGVIQSITVTLNEGFTWMDETTTPLRFERPVFTNVDCGLPDTGGAATATNAGIFAGLGAVLIGGMTLLFGRRRRSLI